MGVSKKEMELQKQERLGAERFNKRGELMKCIEYNSNSDIIVEFQDEFKRTKKACWREFSNGNIRNPRDYERIGIEVINNHGELVKCVDYKNAHSVTVEFQDNKKTRIVTSWDVFIKGIVTNPNSPTIFKVGFVGSKYPTTKNGHELKEFYTWKHMLERCYSSAYKEKHPAYKGVTCCKEWLLYENFYEWLHRQENFYKWLNEPRSALDKDILIKNNKIYSPDTCCLVPTDINSLFVKQFLSRGKYPIGVQYDKRKNKYTACCRTHGFWNPGFLGLYNTIEDAFLAYKEYKENLIKQIAQEEYKKGTITKRCYEAMMNYEVEITD